MAVPPNTDAAFLREVDEELRRDELAKMWKRYGIAALGAIVLGLLAFGGWLIWQSHARTVAGADGETLSKAYDDAAGAHPEAAQAKLTQVAASSASGYRALALMGQGDLLLQKKDLRGAAAKYGQVAGDTSIGQPFRDLALIRQTTTEFDRLKPEVVVARLRGLAVKGNPWFGTAGELVGISYLRMGRRDLAATLYSQITRDPDMTDTIRARAVQLAGELGVDAVTDRAPSDSKGQKSQ